MNKKALVIFILSNVIIILITIILYFIAITKGEYNLKYYLSNISILKLPNNSWFDKIGFVCLVCFLFGHIFGMAENIIDGLIKNEASRKKNEILEILLSIIVVISFSFLSLIFLILPYYIKITNLTTGLLFYAFLLLQAILALIFYRIYIKYYIKVENNN